MNEASESGHDGKLYMTALSNHGENSLPRDTASITCHPQDGTSQSAKQAGYSGRTSNSSIQEVEAGRSSLLSVRLAWSTYSEF